MEEVLCRLWGEVLGVDGVGVEDSFSELGGHSIAAVQLVARVREALEVDLPLRTLLAAQTVTVLAAAIAAGQGREMGPGLPVVVAAPESRHEPFPLTEVQEAYWVGRHASLELGRVGSHLYMEVEGELDLARFESALNRLIERHEMLRAVVLREGLQRILPEVPRYRVEIIDLQGMPQPDVEARLESIREELLHQVLATDRWPLFEIRAALRDDHSLRLHFSLDAVMADARSMRILARELFELYRMPAAELAPLPLSFRDYVLALGRLRESDLYRRSREYWLSRLSDLPPAPELPLSPRAGVLRQPRFRRLSGRLPAPLWRELVRRATRRGLTPSSVLASAFAEALSVWSRSRRFTLNLTLYNRLPLDARVDEVVGDFTTLTLLAVDLTEGGSFESGVRRLQAQLWEDLDHRHMSGVEVQRELARRRPGGLAAVMPVVFTSTLDQRGRQGEEDLLPAGLRSVYSLTQTPQVWLDHQVTEEGGALLVSWDAVADLFPEGFLESLFGAYLRLVERLGVEESAWGEDARRWLAGEQRKRLTADLHATQGPEPSAPLNELFRRQARLRPEQMAFVGAGRGLSYGELARGSRRLARHLRHLGMGRGRLVAVVMEKSLEQGVAVLGVLESGAAYLPLDPQWPKRRLWSLLAQGEVVLVLTQSPWEERLEWPSGVFRLKVDGGLTREEGDDREEGGDWEEAGLTDLAYVIYTSGSTGEPKGVMIDHGAAANTIEAINERFGVGPGDRVLSVSSLSFDLSVYDLLGMLAAGAAVVLPEAGRVRDPAHWADLIAEAGVTIWNSAPALMELLLEHVEATMGEGALPLAGLRCVLLSGDWVAVDLAARVRRVAGEGVRVVSLGGATEASIWSILYEIGEVGEDWSRLPYGRALRNQRVYVLDESFEERAAWATGELYIAGRGLALGYWKDEERTAERFVLHPGTGERLYRTGDLGRYQADGTVELSGRADLQVKVQGHRIEVEEVEAELGRCAGVRQALVRAEGEGGQRRLVAYVVGEPGVELEGDRLRAELRERLPDPLVPSAFRVLAALPLTTNGKIDRAALPALSHAVESVALLRPRTPVERRLTNLWAEVLGLDAPGVHDEFFAVGGNSIRGIRLLARIRDTFQVDLGLEDLLARPTIAALAAVVEERVLVRLESMSEEEALRLLEDSRP